MKRALAISTILALALGSAALAGPKADGKAGASTYEAQCLICHGESGDGQGPAGAALNPKPADFTTPAFWRDRSEAQLMTAIRQGSPGTAMQAYNKLPREDLQNLVAYLRSFEP
jgi:mono/diheme cytochrome c family protein